ncbi:MAG: hypothetical protein IPG96_06240 [Proteobacteria bacterium]|nr:hypothetical protein [Pseudomonadota bacterium]
MAGLSGCGDRTVIVEDLEVAWTLDGANTAAFCAQYGIDHWEVVADGPRETRMRVDCADEAWTSGRAFEAIEVGATRSRSTPARPMSATWASSSPRSTWRPRNRSR